VLCEERGGEDLGAATERESASGWAWTRAYARCQARRGRRRGTKRRWARALLGPLCVAAGVWVLSERETETKS
jgi:hypothetical protein